jgi:hypothetical protein
MTPPDKALSIDVTGGCVRENGVERSDDGSGRRGREMKSGVRKPRGASSTKRFRSAGQL